MSILLLLCSFAQGFVVTGATGGINGRSGARPFRPELTKFQRTGGPAWDLYLQALRKFQDMKQDDALSWFQFNGLCNPLCPTFRIWYIHG